jgi:integration host factor subunit beta
VPVGENSCDLPSTIFGFGRGKLPFANVLTFVCERPATGFKNPLTRRIKDMTKADLIEEVSRLAELTRKDSEVIVETIFDSVVRALRTGDKIEIRGFGSFRTRQRKPRVGRNPKTGDRVEVPPKKIPFFKPSKELKDMVNRDGEKPKAAVAEAVSGEAVVAKQES